MTAADLVSNMHMPVSQANPDVQVSVILLDWSVRESFHSLHYLNRQTVPRDKYEIIWIEFYDHKPAALVRLQEKAQAPVLDKWLIMGYPKQVSYHKHRMYNAGIVLAEGQICVLCDSDAIFEPTFIEHIIKAFQEQPNAVIHLDEVRSYSKKHYPFDYPTIQQVLAKGCVNWTGRTTTGLDNSPDMLHAANYGACMAAWRQDLIQIGGADEHIDYLGYICGPYELTFRLGNLGRQEHWLRDAYLYHVWHPNTSGCNVERRGPDDGRGISLRALQARDSGRIEPYKLNAAMARLRDGKVTPTQAVYLLAQNEDKAWLPDNGIEPVEAALAAEDWCGYRITYYRGVWYGIRTSEGRFDPLKVQFQQYRQCFSASSKVDLLELLYSQPRGLYRLLIEALRLLPLPRRLKNYGRRFVTITHKPKSLTRYGANPQLIVEGYRGYNIVYYRGKWYGLGQSEGHLDVARMESGQYRHCIKEDCFDALTAAIRRKQTFTVRMKNALVMLSRLGKPAGTAIDP